MGTAESTRNWSLVTGNCRCGLRACQRAQREAWARRLAILEAQEGTFEEPTRSARVARPLLLTAYEPERLAS